MRSVRPHHRRGTAVVSACALVLLAGCDKLTPNGGSDTMTMLRSGAQQVCVASDIRKTLHDLIIPKAADLPVEGSPEDKLAAINSVTLSYDLTTLQGFDKAVSKATCNTTVSIAGQDGSTRQFSVDYVISPSADDQNAFIVTANSTAAKTFATELIAVASQQLVNNRKKQEEDADRKQAQDRVLTVVSPKWLTGTWIVPEMNPVACSDGRALTFLPDQTLGGGVITGRWTLSADQLHVVGQGSNGPIELAGTITAADPVSFAITAADGTSTPYRRCTASEIHPSLPDTIGADAPAAT